MKYTTFEKRVVDTDKIDHQHLSNIYWFGKILAGNILPVILKRIETEFNGEILPYRPKSSFKKEISTLDERGYLVWKEVDGIRIADIVFQNKTVGQACYIDDHRGLLINEILK